MPPTHLALLRGINVGGKNQIRMKDLDSIFVDIGMKEVKTYIQSGNVVFTPPARYIDKLPAVIAAAIEKRLGLQVPVVVLERQELASAILNNPFPELAAHPKQLHLVALAATPSSEAIASLDPLRSAPDRYVVHGRFIYLDLPNGAATSKLTNSYFDSRLKTVSTARNWATISALFNMMT